MSELIWNPSSVLPARGQKILAVFGEKEAVMAGFFSNDARNFGCSLGQISWQTVRCWAAWPEVPSKTNPVRDDIAPKIANHYPEWVAFSDHGPMEGRSILVATMSGNRIEKIGGPYGEWSGYPIPDQWTHWCPASVLPPAKRDYCREAWEKLSPVHEPFSSKSYRVVYSNDGGGCSVNLEVYRTIWNSAIACAKEKGLEKV